MKGSEHRRNRPVRAGLTLAFALMLGSPGAASAAGWATTASAQQADAGDLVTFGTSGAVVVWTSGGRDPECSQTPDRRLVARRSTDGGQTWQAAVLLTQPGDPVDAPALAAQGNRVDVVAVAAAGRLIYRRSWDAGATWSSTTVLATNLADGHAPAIAHTGAQVSVGWLDTSGRIRTRTSVDNGRIFASAVSLGAGRSPPLLAIGGGTTYIAFEDLTNRLRLRRSFDAGATWPASTPIAYLPPTHAGIDIAAAGNTSIIAYKTTAARIAIRRSLDAGRSYKPAVTVSATVPGAPFQPTRFGGPTISIHAGAWILGYSEEESSGGYVRSSRDAGGSWSAPVGLPVGNAVVAAATSAGHWPVLAIQYFNDCGVAVNVLRR